MNAFGGLVFVLSLKWRANSWNRVCAMPVLVYSYVRPAWFHTRYTNISICLIFRSFLESSVWAMDMPIKKITMEGCVGCERNGRKIAFFVPQSQPIWSGKYPLAFQIFCGVIYHSEMLKVPGWLIRGHCTHILCYLQGITQLINLTLRFLVFSQWEHE